ncbi:MAG: FAD-binding oxidoreductase, partial [Deltaproteobacteria bacterium]|nr:FAD-binding oxidoreductase [Deltaproteobacteria bacterium]
MITHYPSLQPEDIKSLARIVGRDYCHNDRLHIDLYSYDSSPYIHPPEVVVLPGTISEMAQIVALARRRNWPLTGRGAGTSLSGGAVPICGGVLMSLARLNRIVHIDPIEQTVLVECGVVNLVL